MADSRLIQTDVKSLPRSDFLCSEEVETYRSPREQLSISLSVSLFFVSYLKIYLNMKQILQRRKGFHVLIYSPKGPKFRAEAESQEFPLGLQHGCSFQGPKPSFADFPGHKRKASSEMENLRCKPIVPQGRGLISGPSNWTFYW